ncbi:squamosa promoter-binding-like protein 12 [Bidens hawaiensis]|uniref:squamosa promoter-binding-like protein 12 n=1 Tax=Bidens hawaiensis TaxID=980011 RepID=UPI00404B9A05
MEWNTKFDWENLDIDLLEVMHGGGGDGSVLDVANNSSTKSSVSASPESSLKDGIKKSTSPLANGFGLFSDFCNEKKDGISQLDGLVCSGEPFIGLNISKRTYFEDSYAKNHKVSSVLGVPEPSVESKKVKLSSGQSSMPVSRCQVEGCNLDLSSAKDYHRKHKVCETHSKSPKVIVAGFERRFCQKCSRFQSMSEFDDEKRSCRKRLSDHNARRRKPQCEPARLNSTGPYSSFHTATGSINAMTHSRGVQLSNALNTSTLACSRLVPSKGTRAEIFDQDAADIRRALSLLSNSTWSLCELGHIHSTGPTMAQHRLQTVHHTSHLNAQDYLQPNQQATDPLIQLFKSPYENAFQFHHIG